MFKEKKKGTLTFTFGGQHGELRKARKYTIVEN